jgi:hypothetical protein
VPEFPTDYIKADPTVLCGTYQPTFLYELLWNLAVAALLIWADRRFRLGRGQVFWLYVAGYTLGRGWIEMLRIDTANHFLGLRINVFTSIVMFIVAVTILVVRRGVGREDPASLLGRPSRLDPGVATAGNEAIAVEQEQMAEAPAPHDPDGIGEIDGIGDSHATDGTDGADDINPDGAAEGTQVRAAKSAEESTSS